MLWAPFLRRCRQQVSVPFIIIRNHKPPFPPTSLAQTSTLHTPNPLDLFFRPNSSPFSAILSAFLSPSRTPPFLIQPSLRALFLSDLLNIPPAFHHLLPHLPLLRSLHRYTHVAITSFPRLANRRALHGYTGVAGYFRPRHLGPTILQSIQLYNSKRIIHSTRGS